jgi:uncharacterized phiE125 gp8 family phage protein
VTNLSLKLITAPAQDPVTLPEFKEYQRGIDGNDFDITITTLTKAAREAAQDYQNRAFFTQTYELSFDSFPNMPIKIPRPPLQSLVAVKYTDVNGLETTMNINDFVIDKRSEPGRIAFKSGKQWPSVKLQEIDSVVFQFIAGHSDINKVPNVVKLAYMVFITHRLDNPGSDDIPQAFYSLLGTDRLVPV